MSTYPFTAMNTLKGPRIRSAASAGNAVALENWFNIDKIHKIYQYAPVPLRLLRLNEVYLLASPVGLPIRLVRLDVLTQDGQADLFDVQRQETITVALGPKYQLHKYYPDAVIPSVTNDLNVSSSATRNSNFESVGGGKANISATNIMRRRTKKGGRRIFSRSTPFTKSNRTVNAGKNLKNMTNTELQTQYNTAIAHGALNLAGNLQVEQTRRAEAEVAQEQAEVQRVTNAMIGRRNPAEEAELNAELAALEAEIAAEATKRGGGGKLVNLTRVNTSRMYSPALGKSNLNVLLNRINSELKGTRKNNFSYNNPRRSSK
jgi:hypothetical protein